MRLHKHEVNRLRTMLSCATALYPSMRPALQVREAALLRMLRAYRREHGATPQYRVLADLLGWTSQAVCDSISILTSNGYIRPDRKGHRPLETVEAAAFAELVPMVAVMLEIATMDPRDTAGMARTLARTQTAATALIRTIAEASTGAAYLEHLTHTAHRARSVALSALVCSEDWQALPTFGRTRAAFLPALLDTGLSGLRKAA